MANDQISYPMIPLKTWWELRKKFIQSIPGVVTAGYLAASYSVTGCGTDFLQWKWAEMNRAVGEVAA